MKKHIRKFDEAAVMLVSKFPSYARGLFLFASIAGAPIVWIALLLGIVTLRLLANDTSVAAFDVAIICLVPLADIIKLFVRRHRPRTIYADGMRIKSYSFPSSHAYCAALAGGYIAVTVLGFGASLLTLILAASLIISVIAIGLSRVYLGAHYPSDVVAGWSLGGAVLAATTIIAQLITW